MFHRGSLISGGLRSSQKLGAHVATQGRCWLAKPQVLETVLFLLFIYTYFLLSQRKFLGWVLGTLILVCGGVGYQTSTGTLTPQGVHLPLHLLKSFCTPAVVASGFLNLVDPGLLCVRFIHRAKEGKIRPCIFHSFVSQLSVNLFSAEHHLCPCHLN